MCTNKILYSPSPLPFTTPKKRKRGENMNFQQIKYATECLKMMSNRLGQPIYITLRQVEDKGLMPELYKMAKADTPLTIVRAVNRLQKMMLL